MKVAIIGCGIIAHLHAKILHAMEDVSLIAFVDCKLDRANSLKEEYGEVDSQVFSSLEEMSLHLSVDVIHICTPHYLHVPMAIYGLEHGIHVFMEKPPAISRNEYKDLEDVQSKNSNCRLGICFQNRYNESTKALHKLLQSSGKIYGARALMSWSRGKEYYTESGWRGRLDTEGGGALINQFIHTLDLLLLFFGKPIMVEASMQNHHLKDFIEVEDSIDAWLKFDFGTVNFYGTTAYYADAPIIIEIQCSEQIIRMEGSKIYLMDKNWNMKEITSYEGHSLGKDYWGSGHESCIHDFYDSIKSNRGYMNDLQSTKNTFLVMMDLYQSAHNNIMH